MQPSLGIFSFNAFFNNLSNFQKVKIRVELLKCWRLLQTMIWSITSWIVCFVTKSHYFTNSWCDGWFYILVWIFVLMNLSGLPNVILTTSTCLQCKYSKAMSISLHWYIEFLTQKLDTYLLLNYHVLPSHYLIQSILQALNFPLGVQWRPNVRSAQYDGWMLRHGEAMLNRSCSNVNQGMSRPN